jgi:hypothetical protein
MFPAAPSTRQKYIVILGQFGNMRVRLGRGRFQVKGTEAESPLLAARRTSPDLPKSTRCLQETGAIS